MYGDVNAITTCPYCGAIHLNTVCPRIRSIEHYPDGTVKRVELYEPEALPTKFKDRVVVKAEGRWFL